ncbi:MAG: ATP-binding protein [Acidobacteria bacterium]|nr:ATP-binding protein [Acidobacteriota bacterium]
MGNADDRRDFGTASLQAWNIGSEWHRWDPHVHVPGTLFNDGFGGDWDGYLTIIEATTPQVEALGITDYCVLDSYREFRRRQAQGRVPSVRLVFPNIEFRLTVETGKHRPINLHLLFSPVDPHHEQEIERVLAALTFELHGRQYRCSRDDLIQLGQAWDPAQTDERGALVEGAKQFKLNPTELRDLLRKDSWAKENCLVAVSGRTADGTAGLQKDDAFKATRAELESLADIVFSSRPVDRDFWLGKNPSHPIELIEKTYYALKPCLHGSDAHQLEKVLRPDDDRYCWIRSELTFAGLRQTLIEPEARVFIGPQAPPGPSPSEALAELAVADAPWLATPRVPLNPGLVAVIGPKGSGKTALADMIAHGAGAEISDEASFLLKARELLGAGSATLRWASNETQTAQLAEAGSPIQASPAVRYLSQRFVDRLCSSEGLAGALIEEIESVVFEATEPGDRLGATSFDELRQARVDHLSRLRRAELGEIDRMTRAVSEEDAKIKLLPAKQKERAGLAALLETQEREQRALVPKEKRDDAARLASIKKVIAERTKQIEGLKAKVQLLAAFAAEYEQFGRTAASSFSALEKRYSECGLSASDWSQLRPRFAQNAEDLVAPARSRLEAQISAVQSPSATDENKFISWDLARLRAQATELEASVGMAADRAKKLALKAEKLAETRRRLDALDGTLRDLNDAETRRKKAQEDRRDAYGRVFATYVEEEKALAQLYAPLLVRLRSGEADMERLDFFVRRAVNADAWVAEGEDLLDLRRSGPFQGRGSLRAQVEEGLLPVWRSGGADECAGAMQSFLTKHGRDLVSAKRDDTSLEQIGKWLFSTSHVSLEYGVLFDGVDLTRLSPGMRGIVLLMLYLAVDQWDTRPLVVDQPEENLDPQSVYDQLRSYFREAKTRRQVIIVTHNPNLVVNGDADQVIVAHAERTSTAGLPQIHYTSGGLEDPRTREDVCRILEGGERAFLERERRYNLSRDRRL